jgi:hypothetical protein
MKWFFEDPEKVMILQRELDSWEGTPYKHLCGTKKLGCDCIHFAIRVFECPELGLIKRGQVRIPKYNKDWHLHHSDELLYKAMKSHFKLEELPMNPDNPHYMLFGDFMEGDVILHKYGRAMSHASIYSRGKIFHSMDQIGVTTVLIDDERFVSRREVVFRVLP